MKLMKVNYEKLAKYLMEEKISAFQSDEECMRWFNTYDFQNFKTIEEMKAFQGKYGFSIGNNRFHINFDEALDVYEKTNECLNCAVIQKVNECLEKFQGGEIFFDELDRMMKFDDAILREFMFGVDMKTPKLRGAKTIASGEFGLCLHNYGQHVDILVQGGLRKGNEILDLSRFIIPEREYLFLDDSYFSGSTAEVVKREVERCGGIFAGCCVIYDGSKNPQHKVDSFYRYWDHH